MLGLTILILKLMIRINLIVILARAYSHFFEKYQSSARIFRSVFGRLRFQQVHANVISE